MAVAAYASVLSLLRVIDNVQHPSHLRFFPDPTRIDALREKLSFLQDFLELHSKSITEDIEFMARKIPTITYDAEISIDNYVVDRLYRELYPQNDVTVCSTDSIHDEIQRVIKQIAPINEALKKMRATQHDQEQQHKIAGNDKPHNDDHTSLRSSAETNKMVGFDDQLKQVLEKLTGNQRNLVIVPIVGMGGIGKTTLARSLFDHPYNLHRFDVRIWLTISQDYSIENVFRGLLNDGFLGDVEDTESGDETEAKLITKLHKKLYGKRYLIVLDDVWSSKAWEDLKRGFPNNNNGSRVVVTTRLYDIANSLDSQNNSYSMKFLNEDKSWELFSDIAFEKGGRSRELEEIGKEISKRCNGLPLLLVVVGGLLANSTMMLECWQIVKENINSFANSANDEYCLRILSLSYHHLPIHLKPCFLYMRHFEEDSNIEVSQLIKTWVSEGYVKPIRGKTLEEAARIYVEDLVGRNMLLIRRRSTNGNIEICGVHDILMDLSMKESNKEQLSRQLPKTYSVSSSDIACFICSEPETDMTVLDNEIVRSAFDGKMMVCGSCKSTLPEFARSRFVTAVGFKSRNVPLLTRCRWIELYDCEYISVFHTIHLIWNLEILDIRKFNVVLPKEIWEMPQLRHVKVGNFKLRDPVLSTKNDVIVLENLQTLTRIDNFKFTEDIVRRIPNLRKLGVWYDGGKKDWSRFYLQNLARLQKLESLLVISRSTMDLKKVIVFPCSLKKLTLEQCKIAWEDLTVIGLLPSLEVLKLYYQSVVGDEWNPNEGEFLRLKYLKLKTLDLVRWRVDETHFPALEILFLVEMNHLMEIPREIGELPSLKSIYLECCNEDLIDSAEAIAEEQLRNGNEDLLIYS